MDDATLSLSEAETKATEIQPLVDRILEHGRRNHIGERLEAQMRRVYT